MKGFLIADFYVAVKRCWFVLLLLPAMAVITAFGRYSSFSLVLAMFIAAEQSLSILVHENNSQWFRQAMTLPGRRKDYVTAKFAATACIEAFLWAAWVLCYGIRVAMGVTAWRDIAVLIPNLLATGLVFTAIVLPLNFRDNAPAPPVILYLLMGGLFVLRLTGASEVILALPPYITFPASAAILVLSWLLAVRWYGKREF